ncbi:hypothetical protein BDV12DRAFT_179484 [Aspergillus spectabilis]
MCIMHLASGLAAFTTAALGFSLKSSSAIPPFSPPVTRSYLSSYPLPDGTNIQEPGYSQINWIKGTPDREGLIAGTTPLASTNSVESLGGSSELEDIELPAYIYLETLQSQSQNDRGGPTKVGDTVPPTEGAIARPTHSNSQRPDVANVSEDFQNKAFGIMQTNGGSDREDSTQVTTITGHPTRGPDVSDIRGNPSQVITTDNTFPAPILIGQKNSESTPSQPDHSDSKYSESTNSLTSIRSTFDRSNPQDEATSLHGMPTTESDTDNKGGSALINVLVPVGVVSGGVFVFFITFAGARYYVRSKSRQKIN